MSGLCGETTAIGSFSLVAYVPQPLAGFIERLRQEIEPGCTARSHLTFLPPRLLDISVEQIRSLLEAGLRNQTAFRVELGDVRVFPVSHAIHLSVETGWNEASRIHEVLHCGGLICKELFEYHPHVTLAQDLDTTNLDAITDLAKRRWQEYPGPRDFLVDNLTLVQNTLEKGWTSLAEFPLRVPVSV